jgi:hypothetical protein
MNKSLLIQNGIAGGMAGTVADGLFNNEDEHHYAKSAFMGTLAGVGATAIHQSLPSAAKAHAEYVPTPVANVPPTAPKTAPAETPIAPTPQPAPAQPKPPVAEKPVVAPQPAAKPIEQPKPAPQPVEQPKAVQPVRAEPAPVQPTAAPVVAAEHIKPVEQPKPAVVAQPKPAPKPPEPVVQKAEPQVAPLKITPIEPKPAEPPKTVVPVKPAEEPKQEFVGPQDKPLSRKLTKTINSVKQAASGVGNGITDAAKRLSATASQLKIPPIELNISGIGQNVLEKGRTVASGLARSAQALSIAAIASMDLAGGHGLVTQALETASHSVQVQASMATSTMTKAVKDTGEAVSNYRAGDAIVNAENSTIAIDSLHNAPSTAPHFSLDDFTKSNNVNDLMPDVRDLADKFVEEAKKQGINVKITNTLRGGGEQHRLFSIGRNQEQLAETRDDRMFRQAIEEYEHGKITMPHGAVTNADAGDSFHNYSLAFDFVPIVDGKISYDITSKAGKARFQKLGSIGKSIGLEWGGDWKNPDYPHMQLTHGKSIHDLYNGSKNYVKPVKAKYKISSERPTPMSHQAYPLTGAYLYPGIRNAQQNFVGRNVDGGLRKIFSSTNTFEARHEYFKNMSPKDILKMSNEDAKMYNLYRREAEERKLKDSIMYKATQKLDAIKNAASNTYIADLFK